VEDDTFARTYPDIQKLRANSEDGQEILKLMREMARAGMQAEERIKRLELDQAEREGEEKARHEIWGLVRWAIGIAIAIGAFWAGHEIHG